MNCLRHYADLTFTELPFAEQVLVQNVSHENHLIFMRMTVQVAYIFILIVHTKSRFATEAKVNLELGYSSMSCSGNLSLIQAPNFVGLLAFPY